MKNNIQKKILLIGGALFLALVFTSSYVYSADIGQCGNTEDFQDVEQYKGNLGPSTAFVARYQ